MELLSSAEKQALIEKTQSIYTREYLESWRSECDPLADAAVAPFAQSRDIVPDGYPSLLEAVLAYAEHDAACATFVSTVQAVPAWVDFADHHAGSALFRRNGVLTFLIGVSVLISSYGGYRDNKVLALSNRLGDDDSFRRAVETAQFTMDATAHNGLMPGNNGWKAIVNVRLLHARVRQFAMRGGYPVEKFDPPINQEAMCGAIMLFSHGVIRALELLGVRVSDVEKESYHALWRYGGWLMGVDLALLPERHIEEQTLFDLHQYGYIPDEDTIRLTDGTVRGITRGARSLPLWLKLMGGGFMQSEAFVRNFVGYTANETLRDFLRLHPSLFWKVMFSGIQGGLRGLSRVEAAVPRVRPIMERLQGNLMARIVTELSADHPVQYNNIGRLRSASTD